MQNQKIYIDFINCVDDHVHITVSLRAEQSISKVMQLIKGESSYWVNKNKLIPTKFEWQDEYYAISVSDSVMPVVRDYIKNQEEHHRHKSFEEEYEEMMKHFIEHNG